MEGVKQEKERERKRMSEKNDTIIIAELKKKKLATHSNVLYNS